MMINPKIKNPVTFIVIFTILFSCISLKSFAQVVINGANIHSLNSSIIYIQTDSLLIEGNGYLEQEGLLVIDKDLVVNNGKLDVNGTIDIENNLLNNDSIEGFSTSSLILLNGNWINNNIFTSGQNTTALDGNIQNISGAVNTSFFNLNTIGALADVKSLINVNVSVQNILNLTNVELATNQNNLTVTNPSINAIIRNEGFVSSLDTGKLKRVTNSNTNYLFPTGSSLGVQRYRPIEINPESNTLDTFGVRLANVNATSEGFSVEVLEDELCLVNPNFYHRIYGEKQAGIQIFYIPAQDGGWTDMAHWQNNPEWEDMGSEGLSTSNGFTRMTIANWNNNSHPAYALAIRTPFLDAGNDIEAVSNEDVNIGPIYIYIYIYIYRSKHQ